MHLAIHAKTLYYRVFNSFVFLCNLYVVSTCKNIANFVKSEIYMSIVETRPDDGTYEWRHLMPNKYVRDFVGPLAPSLDGFEAKIRFLKKDERKEDPHEIYIKK